MSKRFYNNDCLFGLMKTGSIELQEEMPDNGAMFENDFVNVRQTAATLLLFAIHATILSMTNSVGRHCCRNMAVWVRLTEN